MTSRTDAILIDYIVERLDYFASTYSNEFRHVCRTMPELKRKLEHQQHRNTDTNSIGQSPTLSSHSTKLRLDQSNFHLPPIEQWNHRFAVVRMCVCMCVCVCVSLCHGSPNIVLDCWHWIMYYLGLLAHHRWQSIWILKTTIHNENETKVRRHDWINNADANTRETVVARVSRMDNLCLPIVVIRQVERTPNCPLLLFVRFH
jgi:hypothetical protein